MYKHIKKEHLFIFLAIFTALVLFTYFDDNFNYTGLTAKETCAYQGYQCCSINEGEGTNYFSLDETCGNNQQCWSSCSIKEGETNLITTSAVLDDIWSPIKNFFVNLFNKETIGGIGSECIGKPHLFTITAEQGGSHASKFIQGRDAYDKKVCSKNDNGQFKLANENDEQKYPLITLYSETNSHVKIPNIDMLDPNIDEDPDYVKTIFIKPAQGNEPVSCSYQANSPEEGYECLFSISDSTNAHIGACSNNNQNLPVYNTKVWCKLGDDDSDGDNGNSGRDIRRTGTCGNSIKEIGEECDGSDFGLAGNSNLCNVYNPNLYSSGALRCNPSDALERDRCKIDITNCIVSDGNTAIISSPLPNQEFNVGEEITFIGMGNNAGITRYAWRFKSGDSFLQRVSSALENTITHTYTEAGIYSVNLRIKYGQNWVSSTSLTIVVSENEIPICGNSIKEIGEECDGSDFGLAGNSNLCNVYNPNLYSSGALRCNPSDALERDRCKIDITNCIVSDGNPGGENPFENDEIIHVESATLNGRVYGQLTTGQGVDSNIGINSARAFCIEKGFEDIDEFRSVACPQGDNSRTYYYRNGWNGFVGCDPRYGILGYVMCKEELPPVDENCEIPMGDADGDGIIALFDSDCQQLDNNIAIEEVMLSSNENYANTNIKVDCNYLILDSEGDEKRMNLINEKKVVSCINAYIDPTGNEEDIINCEEKTVSTGNNLVSFRKCNVGDIIADEIPVICEVNSDCMIYPESGVREEFISVEEYTYCSETNEGFVEILDNSIRLNNANEPGEELKIRGKIVSGEEQSTITLKAGLIDLQNDRILKEVSQDINYERQYSEKSFELSMGLPSIQKDTYFVYVKAYLKNEEASSCTQAFASIEVISDVNDDEIEFECGEGEIQECDTGLFGICSTGTQECINGEFTECMGDFMEGEKQEMCNDNLDNNCDGQIDENCAAPPSSNTDSDNDGLPDTWEMQNFNTLLYNANDDPDDDGITNIEEYLSSSDPNTADKKRSLLWLWIILGVVFLAMIIFLSFKFLTKPKSGSRISMNSSVDPRLKSYVQDSLKKGFTKNQIKQALLTKGWSQSDIEKTLK